MGRRSKFNLGNVNYRYYAQNGLPKHQYLGSSINLVMGKANFAFHSIKAWIKSTEAYKVINIYVESVREDGDRSKRSTESNHFLVFLKFARNVICVITIQINTNICQNSAQLLSNCKGVNTPTVCNLRFNNLFIWLWLNWFLQRRTVQQESI